MTPFASGQLLVNIGCGSVFHHQWLNIDKYPQSKEIIRCDINCISKLVKENTVDMFYVSHVIEHLPRETLCTSLKILYNFLRPNGILRIVVPDLEKLATDYLSVIQSSDENDKYKFEHEWIVAEMFDQCTRREPGGRIKDLLINASQHQREFVSLRCGKNVSSAYSFTDQMLSKRKSPTGISLLNRAREFKQYLFNLAASKLWDKHDDDLLKGEKHLWMYDFYQLRRALCEVGYVNTIRHSFNTSQLPEFHNFCLDQDNNGLERKPDSLYVEARKLS